MSLSKNPKIEFTYESINIGDIFYPKDLNELDFYWIVREKEGFPYFQAESIYMKDNSSGGSGSFTCQEFHSVTWNYKPNKTPDFQKQLQEIVSEGNEVN